MLTLSPFGIDELGINANTLWVETGKPRRQPQEGSEPLPLHTHFTFQENMVHARNSLTELSNKQKVYSWKIS